MMTGYGAMMARHHDHRWTEAVRMDFTDLATFAAVAHAAVSADVVNVAEREADVAAA
jgi:hypothetical protein